MENVISHPFHFLGVLFKPGPGFGVVVECERLR
jgi:hypothetical protein